MLIKKITVPLLSQWNISQGMIFDGALWLMHSSWGSKTGFYRPVSDVIF